MVTHFFASHRPRWVSLIALGLVASMASQIQAGLITVPTTLGPAEQYRLAFVTDGLHEADSSDITVYNTFVTNTANGIPELTDLSTTWKAIASTASIDARDNTGTLPSYAGGSLGVPIFLLNDTLLAPSYDFLWSTNDLVNGLGIDEYGDVQDGRTWTGSDQFGQALSPLGASFPTYGEAGWTDEMWISYGPDVGQTANFHFYAMSGLLTTPTATPEPSSFFIMSVWAVGMLGYGVLRKRKRG